MHRTSPDVENNKLKNGVLGISSPPRLSMLNKKSFTLRYRYNACDEVWNPRNKTSRSYQGRVKLTH